MSSKNYTVTAHTGSMNTPANSIESIIAGFASGADIVEIDIRFDSDLTPVLSHDKVDSKNSYTTLSQAFDTIRNYPDKKVNLDLKETTNLPEVERLAKEKGVYSQIFFTGVEDEFVEAVRKETSVPYYLNFGKKTNMAKFESYIKFLIEKTKDAGAIGINMTKENCNPKLVDKFRKEGLLVSVWTITDIENDRIYLDSDVDNITCKNPDEVTAYIGKH